MIFDDIDTERLKVLEQELEERIRLEQDLLELVRLKLQERGA